MRGNGSEVGERGARTQGLYIPNERYEEYRRALRKVQRRRPGRSASEVMIDSLIEAANRYQDIPGLDDLPPEQEDAPVKLRVAKRA